MDKIRRKVLVRIQLSGMIRDPIVNIVGSYLRIRHVGTFVRYSSVRISLLEIAALLKLLGDL